MKKVTWLLTTALFLLTPLGVWAQDTYPSAYSGAQMDMFFGIVEDIGDIDGLIKCDGEGNCELAVAGTDYLEPDGDGSGLTNLPSATITDLDLLPGDSINDNKIDAALIPTAASGVSGVLSAANWATFNAKQSALTAGVDYLAPTGDGSGITGFTSDQITDLNVETVLTGDLEEEVHASEHAAGGTDPVFPDDPNEVGYYLQWDDTENEPAWAPVPIISDIDDLPGDTVDDGLIDAVLLPPTLVTEQIDTLAELNSIVADATLLDDGAIADSTAIGLANGGTYATYGAAGDDSLNELFAAIDTAISGLADGHDAVTIAGGISGLTLSTQELSLHASLEAIADGAFGTTAFGGLANGGTYTNFGVAGDDTLDELFAAIDTTFTGLPGGHVEATLAAGTNGITLTGQEFGVDAFLENIADLSDPGAYDALFFLDDTDNAVKFLTLGSTLAISGTVLSVATNGITVNQMANTDHGHVAWNAGTAVVQDFNINGEDANVGDDDVIFFGDGNDVDLHWDNAADKFEIEVTDGGEDSEVYIYNSNATYAANLEVEGEITASNFIGSGAGLSDVQPLDSILTDLSDGIIESDLVNTDYPWADSEVVAALTISGGTINDTPIGASDPDTGAFTDLEADTLTLAGATAPSWTFYDSDAEGGDADDEEAARISVDMATETENEEDGVMQLIVQETGDPTVYVELDGENERVEINRPVTSYPQIVTDADGIDLSAAQMNSVIVMTGAGDVYIPANQCDTPDGKWIVVKSTAAHANSVGSFDGSDKFVLSDGSETGAGDEIDLAGAKGSQVSLMCLTANTWWVTGEIGTVTDGDEN